MKRRILALLLVFAMFAALMTGCASGKQETAANDTAQTEQTAPEQTADLPQRKPKLRKRLPNRRRKPPQNRKRLPSPTASNEKSSCPGTSPASRPAAPLQR